MRTILFASAAVFFATTGLAFAGEGNGEPFPGPDFAVTTRTSDAHLAMKNQDPFSYAAGGTTMTLGGSYTQAASKNQDPFPFAAAPTVIGQPGPSALAQRAAGNTHG